MRRSGLTNVLLYVIMLSSSQAASPNPIPIFGEEVRIAASLEDAAVAPHGPAVLVFFSLDCPICWEELFEARYMIEKNSIPIALVGISADSREDLEPFLGKHAFFHPVVCDRGRELFRKFKVKLEPLTVVIDGGRVIHRDNTAEGMDIRREKLKQCLLGITARRPS